MNERQGRLGKFVVTCGDASELLDATEETLDQVASLVNVPIECSGREPIGTRRDKRLAWSSIHLASGRFPAPCFFGRPPNVGGRARWG